VLRVVEKQEKRPHRIKKSDLNSINGYESQIKISKKVGVNVEVYQNQTVTEK